MTHEEELKRYGEKVTMKLFKLQNDHSTFVVWVWFVIVPAAFCAGFYLGKMVAK